MLGLGNSLFTSGVSGEFSLDQVGTMVAWYKFNELQTVADSDGDGDDEVSSWSSSFGSSNPITQSTAIRQPAYNSGHLDFHQPSQQKLRAATDFGSGLRDFTIMFCIQPDNYTGNRTLMGNQDVSSHLFRFSSNNTSTRLQFNGAAFDSVASQAFPLARFILTITRDTSANPNPVKIYSSTTEVVSGTKLFGSQTSLATFDQFGCQAGSSNPYDGKISEVAIWSNVLTDGDRAAAIADMELRTGV